MVCLEGVSLGVELFAVVYDMQLGVLERVLEGAGGIELGGGFVFSGGGHGNKNIRARVRVNRSAYTVETSSTCKKDDVAVGRAPSRDERVM